MTRPAKREPHITPHPAAGGSTSSSSRLINGGAETSDMNSREATERRLLRSLYRDVKRIITGTFCFNFRSFFSSPLSSLFISFPFYLASSQFDTWVMHFCWKNWADEREDVERVDSDKFNSIINQVEDLHKSGIHY